MVVLAGAVMMLGLDWGLFSVCVEYGYSVGRLLRTVETLLIRHIVDQQDTHGASVVCGGDCSEALLSRGIPYLQLDALTVQLDCADLEVNSDGGNEGRGEGVFAEAQQAAGLAYAGVADEEELDLWRAISMVWMWERGKTASVTSVVYRGGDGVEDAVCSGLSVQESHNSFGQPCRRQLSRELLRRS